jgi:hypothetical protein
MQNLATEITARLYRDQTFKPLCQLENADDIAKDVTALLNGYYRKLHNHLLNTAPKTPGDDSREKDYPSRETLRADDPLLPVPDPAETETSQESKTSIPDYGEYQDHVRVLEASGQTLWNDEAGDTDKVQSIKDAREAMNNILGMLKQF